MLTTSQSRWEKKEISKQIRAALAQKPITAENLRAMLEADRPLVYLQHRFADRDSGDLAAFFAHDKRLTIVINPQADRELALWRAIVSLYVRKTCRFQLLSPKGLQAEIVRIVERLRKRKRPLLALGDLLGLVVPKFPIYQGLAESFLRLDEIWYYRLTYLGPKPDRLFADESGCIWQRIYGHLANQLTVIQELDHRFALILTASSVAQRIRTDHPDLRVSKQRPGYTPPAR